MDIDSSDLKTTRRNLYAISSFVIFYWISGATIGSPEGTQISILGGTLNLEAAKQPYIYGFIFALYIWLVWRFMVFFKLKDMGYYLLAAYEDEVKNALSKFIVSWSNDGEHDNKIPEWIFISHTSPSIALRFQFFPTGKYPFEKRSSSDIDEVRTRLCEWTTSKRLSEPSIELIRTLSIEKGHGKDPHMWDSVASVILYIDNFGTRGVLKVLFLTELMSEMLIPWLLSAIGFVILVCIGVEYLGVH